MSAKATRILSIVLMILPSLGLIMSAVMKLSHSQQIVDGFGKIGLGNYITLIGVIELISVALFLFPKTHKIGFLLICSYLGGAISIELSTGQVPSAAIFLAIVWISVFLKDKLMFLNAPKV
jgi:hypothetical protein